MWSRRDKTKSETDYVCSKSDQTLLRTEWGKRYCDNKQERKREPRRRETGILELKLHAKLEKNSSRQSSVFESPTAMDMGIQYGDITGPSPEGKEGSSKWHNQLLDGKMSDLP